MEAFSVDYIIMYVCIALLVAFLPFFILVAMLSRIRHDVKRLRRLVESLGKAKEPGVGNHRSD